MAELRRAEPTAAVRALIPVQLSEAMASAKTAMAVRERITSSFYPESTSLSGLASKYAARPLVQPCGRERDPDESA